MLEGSIRRQSICASSIFQDFCGESTLVIHSQWFQCLWIVFHVAVAKVTAAARNYKALVAWFDFASDEILYSVLIFSLCF